MKGINDRNHLAGGGNILHIDGNVFHNASKVLLAGIQVGTFQFLQQLVDLLGSF